MNIALNSGATLQKAQFWHDSIQNCLDSTRVKYTMVMEKYLVGLLLCIFVKDSLLPVVKDVRGCSTGVGLMGMMGNKGGVAIRMSIYDTSICFVCAHLAAHRENIAGRNADFKSIFERSIFISEINLNASVGGDTDSGGEGVAIPTGDRPLSFTPTEVHESPSSRENEKLGTSGNKIAEQLRLVEMPKRAAAQYLAEDLDIPGP